MSDHLDDAHLELLGRLLAGPAAARRGRMAALGRLLGDARARWSPGELGGVCGEHAVSLRRAGAVSWDQRAGAHLITPHLRPTLSALYLLARHPPSDAGVIAAQADLPDWAEPGGADHEQLSLVGLIDLLEADVSRLSAAQAAAISEQRALAALLERHVSDAERALAAVASDGQLRERAVALVGALAREVAALLERLAAHAGDRLPAGRAHHSGYERRTRARRLDLASLASLVGTPGCAPRVPVLPPEAMLAAAACHSSGSDTGALPEALVPVTVAALHVRDPLDALRARHAHAGHVDLLDELSHLNGFVPAADTVRLFARLHDRLLSNGTQGLQVGALECDPCPGVARVTTARAYEHVAA